MTAVVFKMWRADQEDVKNPGVLLTTRTVLASSRAGRTHTYPNLPTGLIYGVKHPASYFCSLRSETDRVVALKQARSASHTYLIDVTKKGRNMK